MRQRSSSDCAPVPAVSRMLARLPVLALSLSSTLLHASGGEGGGAHEGAAAQTFLGLPINLWQGINLVLFIALLVWVLRKPVATFFGGRTEEVAKQLQKAEEDRAKAAALLAEIESRVARLDGELAEIRARAQREAVEEQAALLKAADDDANKLVAKAHGEMDARVRAARKELTAYAGDLAVGIAKEILAKNVTADDESRIRAEGVAALREGGAARGA